MMISIFRKIRKRLFDNGNLTRYVLYALGEILLVVVGILIALQVNNWNEDRIASEQEKELLTNVLESLISDSLAFARTLQSLDNIKQLHNNIYLYTISELNADQIKNTNLIRRSSELTPVTKTNYPDLANLVRNQNLKNEVLSYYQMMDLMAFNEDNFNHILEEKVRSYLAEKHLLNYAYHFQAEPGTIPMLNHKKFIQELENEDFIQLLFNVYVKVELFTRTLTRSINKNAILRDEIKKHIY